MHFKFRKSLYESVTEMCGSSSLSLEVTTTYGLCVCAFLLYKSASFKKIEYVAELYTHIRLRVLTV